MKFLVSLESQAYWAAQTGCFPVTTAVHDEDVFRQNIEQYPQFQTAIDQLHDLAPQCAGALMSVFSEARKDVESSFEDMLSNNEDPQAAVDRLAEEINKVISDYNIVNA